MAAFNFPNSPSTNDLHTENNVTWKWNGTVWKRINNSYLTASTLDVSGIGTFGGNVDINSTLEVSGISNFDSTVKIADKIEHLGDSNTNIRFPAADTVSIETGGSERLRITSGGNILAGRNSDYWSSRAAFQEDKQGRTAILVKNDTNHADASSSIILNAYGNSWTINCGSTARDSNAFTINQDATSNSNQGTERFRIDTSGDIGLGGITSPLWTTGGGMHLNDAYGIGFGNGGSGRPDFQIVTTAGATLDFRCGFGADTADIVMNTSGYLGIGDASPTKPLTVGTATPVVLLDDQSSRTLEIRGPSTTHNATVLTTSNHDLLLGTNNTERLRIRSDGSIQIGTSPANLAAIGAGPTLGINGAAPEITLRDTATNNPYAWIATNDHGSLVLAADQGNNAGSSIIDFRVDGTEILRITSGSVAQFYSPDGNSKGYIYQTNSDNFVVEADTSNSIDGDLLLRAVADGGTIQMVCGGNNERLRIKSNGKVTINPYNTYHSPTNGEPTLTLSNESESNLSEGGRWSHAAIGINNTTHTASGGSKSQIVFGYLPRAGGYDFTYGSAYMGATSVSQSGAGFVDLVFGTKSVTSDTQPTERMRIDNTGYVTAPSKRQAAFCARVSGTISNISANGILIYNTDNHGSNGYQAFDAGGNYNTSDGKFTCPVSGVYYFEAQAMTMGWANGDSTQDLLVMKSNRGTVSNPRQRRSYFRTHAENNGYFTNSVSGLYNATAGDTVWVIVTAGCSVSNLSYSYFSGFLVG